MYSSYFRRRIALTATRTLNTRTAQPLRPHPSRVLSQLTKGFHAIKKWEELKRKASISDPNIPIPINSRSFWDFPYAPAAQPKAQPEPPAATNTSQQPSGTPTRVSTAANSVPAGAAVDTNQDKNKNTSKDTTERSPKNKDESADGKIPKIPDWSQIPRSLPMFLGGGPFI